MQYSQWQLEPPRVCAIQYKLPAAKRTCRSSLCPSCCLWLLLPVACSPRNHSMITEGCSLRCLVISTSNSHSFRSGEIPSSVMQAGCHRLQHSTTCHVPCASPFLCRHQYKSGPPHIAPQRKAGVREDVRTQSAALSSACSACPMR